MAQKNPANRAATYTLSIFQHSVPGKWTIFEKWISIYPHFFDDTWKDNIWQL